MSRDKDHYPLPPDDGGGDLSSSLLRLEKGYYRGLYDKKLERAKQEGKDGTRRPIRNPAKDKPVFKPRPGEVYDLVKCLRSATPEEERYISESSEHVDWFNPAAVHAERTTSPSPQRFGQRLGSRAAKLTALESLAAVADPDMYGDSAIDLLLELGTQDPFYDTFGSAPEDPSLSPVGRTADNPPVGREQPRRLGTSEKMVRLKAKMKKEVWKKITYGLGGSEAAMKRIEEENSPSRDRRSATVSPGHSKRKLSPIAQKTVTPAAHHKEKKPAYRLTENYSFRRRSSLLTTVEAPKMPSRHDIVEALRAAKQHFGAIALRSVATLEPLPFLLRDEGSAKETYRRWNRISTLTASSPEAVDGYEALQRHGLASCLLARTAYSVSHADGRMLQLWESIQPNLPGGEKLLLRGFGIVPKASPKDPLSAIKYFIVSPEDAPFDLTIALACSDRVPTRRYEDNDCEEYAYIPGIAQQMAIRRTAFEYYSIDGKESMWTFALEEQARMKLELQERLTFLSSGQQCLLDLEMTQRKRIEAQYSGLLAVAQRASPTFVASYVVNCALLRWMVPQDYLPSHLASETLSESSDAKVLMGFYRRWQRFRHTKRAQTIYEHHFLEKEALQQRETIQRCFVQLRGYRVMKRHPAPVITNRSQLFPDESSPSARTAPGGDDSGTGDGSHDEAKEEEVDVSNENEETNRKPADADADDDGEHQEQGAVGDDGHEESHSSSSFYLGDDPEDEEVDHGLSGEFEGEQEGDAGRDEYAPRLEDEEIPVVAEESTLSPDDPTSPTQQQEEEEPDVIPLHRWTAQRAEAVSKALRFTLCQMGVPLGTARITFVGHSCAGTIGVAVATLWNSNYSFEESLGLSASRRSSIRRSSRRFSAYRAFTSVGSISSAVDKHPGSSLKPDPSRRGSTMRNTRGSAAVFRRAYTEHYKVSTVHCICSPKLFPYGSPELLASLGIEVVHYGVPTDAVVGLPTTFSHFTPAIIDIFSNGTGEGASAVQFHLVDKLSVPTAEFGDECRRGHDIDVLLLSIADHLPSLPGWLRVSSKHILSEDSQLELFESMAATVNGVRRLRYAMKHDEKAGLSVHSYDWKSVLDYL